MLASEWRESETSVDQESPLDSRQEAKFGKLAPPSPSAGGEQHHYPPSPTYPTYVRKFQNCQTDKKSSTCPLPPSVGGGFEVFPNLCRSLILSAVVDCCCRLLQRIIRLKLSREGYTMPCLSQKYQQFIPEHFKKCQKSTKSINRYHQLPKKHIKNTKKYQKTQKVPTSTDHPVKARGSSTMPCLKPALPAPVDGNLSFRFKLSIILSSDNPLPTALETVGLQIAIHWKDQKLGIQ